MCWTNETLEINCSLIFESREKILEIDDTHDIIE
jgi:hypothetical protein